MKRFVIAMAFICALSSVALAGDIPSDGSASPAPHQPTQTTSTAPGEVPTVGVAEQVSSDALSALLSVLGFLAV